jgi:hypothetical protein
MIRETIVTTADRSGAVHIAPLGLIAEGDHWIVAPFRPSRTLDNLREVPFAVASHVDDVRVFAGCLTGRRDWPLAPTGCPVPRLAAALSHWELSVQDVTEDERRPRFRMQLAAAISHAPTSGFNRAKAAVIELAILSSRLSMLPREKVAREIGYLEIAVEKTAGAEEEEAWTWLMEKVRRFYGGDP